MNNSLHPVEINIFIKHYKHIMLNIDLRQIDKDKCKIETRSH